MEDKDEDLIVINRSKDKRDHYYFARLKTSESITENFDSKYDGLQELIDLYENNEITASAGLAALEQLRRQRSLQNVSGSLEFEEQLIEEAEYLIEIEDFYYYLRAVALFEETNYEPLMMLYASLGRVSIFFLDKEEVDGEVIEIIADLDFYSRSSVSAWLESEGIKYCTIDQIEEMKSRIPALIGLPENHMMVLGGLVEVNLN
jgi:hypothetical protein